MLERTKEEGVKLYVCQQSMTLFQMTEADLLDGVEIMGAATIIDLTLDADVVMYF
jgi:predicted peroxiredoxin